MRKAIDDGEAGEADAAMLHDRNAIDGTAKKPYPELGSNVRFTQLLRDNYPILGIEDRMNSGTVVAKRRTSRST